MTVNIGTDPDGGLGKEKHMGITTIPSFVIKVIVVGRKDPIETMAYDSRDAAEADLRVLNAARTSSGEVSLPGLVMSGSHIQAAHIEDRSASFGTIDMPSPWSDPDW
jgi:hypothetical protein